MNLIGEHIRVARKTAGLTQKELAEKLGVSVSMIAQYETGARNPKPGTIEKIGNALNCDLLWILDAFAKSSIKDSKIAFQQYQTLLDILNNAIPEIDPEKSMFYKDVAAFGGIDIYLSCRDSFNRLNDTGKQEAIKRINELARLKEYTRKESDHASTNDEETR